MAAFTINSGFPPNASPLRRPHGIFRILQPIGGIVEDVLPDGVQFFIMADDRRCKGEAFA
jgi:hypothetical protein